MKVYLLTETECHMLRKQNHPGAQISPCDYGLGPCIELAVLERPEFKQHLEAIEALKDIKSREIIEISPLTGAI